MPNSKPSQPKLGRLTWLCILAGLAAFVVLAFWPWLRADAVLFTLYTPLVAAAVTGTELLLNRRVGPGVSVLLAVALAVFAFAFGVRF